MIRVWFAIYGWMLPHKINKKVFDFEINFPMFLVKIAVIMKFAPIMQNTDEKWHKDVDTVTPLTWKGSKQYCVEEISLYLGHVNKAEWNSLC